MGSNEFRMTSGTVSVVVVEVVGGSAGTIVGAADALTGESLIR